MFDNFWVPMVNCFEGGTSSNNQDFSTLDSGPTGRVTGGNPIVKCRPSWESHSVAPQALQNDSFFDSGTCIRST